MELKILLVTSRRQVILFLVEPEREAQIRLAVKASSERCSFLCAQTIQLRPVTEVRRSRRTVRKLDRLIRRADTIAVTDKPIRSPQVVSRVCQAHLLGIRVIDVDAALLALTPRIPTEEGDVIRLLSKNGLQQNFTLRAYERFRTLFEPVAALFLIVLFLPIFFAVALAIKLTSSGPVIYSQVRVGFLGRDFRLHKFRSMQANAEVRGPAWASTDPKDRRLTSIGRFLRSTHLDELPQLWNVARGELSFIGPRPERPVFVEKLRRKIPLFDLRTLLKPGITGWAQVRLGYANSISDSKRKLEHDLFYLLRRSPGLDAKILLNTAGVLLAGGTEAKRRGLANPAADMEAPLGAHEQMLELGPMASASAEI